MKFYSKTIARWAAIFGAMSVFSPPLAFAQNIIYEEHFDAVTVSNVRTPEASNLEQWSETDKIKCRPFDASRHVEKLRKDDGTFSLTNEHTTDSRFELQESRPFLTFFDQNGSRAMQFDGQIIFNKPHSAGETGEFFAEQMSRKPNFGMLAEVEIDEFEAQGWAVESLQNGQTRLTRPNMEMRIVPLEMLIEVLTFGGGNQIEKRNRTFFRRDAAGFLMPREEIESTFWTVSNGNPVERRTVTVYSNYFISEFVGERRGPQKGQKAAFEGQILPNPVGDQFLIDLPERDGLMDVRVFDQTGKAIIERLNQPIGAFPIDARGLPSGSFFVQIRGENLHLMLRLVKL